MYGSDVRLAPALGVGSDDSLSNSKRVVPRPTSILSHVQVPSPLHQMQQFACSDRIEEQATVKRRDQPKCFAKVGRPYIRSMQTSSTFAYPDAFSFKRRSPLPSIRTII
jgi:hypothetical protein